MLALIRPTRIAIYLNPDGKDIKTVKAETGCDYIINGGLFESLTKPCPLLKVNGLWWTSQPWNAWGMAWNDASDCALLNVSDTRQNFISCVDLINPWDGGASRLSYPSDMGGSRQRTAWGIINDGRHLLFVDHTGRTPEQLRDDLSNAVTLKSLMMLDGGGSTQGIFKDKALTASTRVANFICFWTDDVPDNDVGDKKEESTTATLKKGISGSSVKELQTKLNAFGFGLIVDGNFGTATYNAVRAFQAAYGIDADGIAGNATQAALAAVKALASATGTNADKLVSKALSYLGHAEPNGDDKFIKAYNEATGAGFNMTVSWCQIFVWYCLTYFNFDCPETASCTAARKYWQENGKWRNAGYTPKKGDIIYYDFDGSGDCDHVGIVISVDEQYITAIEGNTGTVLGDSVALKRHDRGAAYITGYADALAPTASQKETDRYIVVFGKNSAEALAKAYNGEVIRYDGKA